jgi:hypothetical protein
MAHLSIVEESILIGYSMDPIKRLRHIVRHSFFLFGLLSILWLLLRTGTKPTRISYPCQQTSAAAGGLWLTSYILPIILTLRSPNISSLKSKSMILAGIFLALFSLMFVSTNVFNINEDIPVSYANKRADMKLVFF